MQKTRFWILAGLLSAGFCLSALAETKNTDIGEDARRFGAMLTPTFDAAIRLSHYTAPSRPTVALVQNGTVKDMINCKGTKCENLAVFNSETNSVYVEVSVLEIPDILARGLLVHEFVHFLQYVNGKSFKTCEDLVKVEKEAYQAQNDFLIENNYQITWEWPLLTGNTKPCETNKALK